MLKNITNDEMNKILEKHLKWVRREDGGERADLRGANLQCANLHGANLQGANLRGANLQGANLHGANLQGANLHGANLFDADLCGANFSNADLRGTNLRGASLCGASLCGASLCGVDFRGASLCGVDFRGASLRDANLRGTNLRGASLCGANLCGAKDVPYIPFACPDSGSFIAWKKANGLIVKLLVTEDARRSSATGRKCRCDKAKVVAIENIDGTKASTNIVNSNYADNFIYEVGKIVEEPDFCEDRFIECAKGIHFFINRQEAVDYSE